MPDLILDWILTYLLHSTVALIAVCTLSNAILRRFEPMADLEQMLWKTALVGPLVSATLVGIIHDRTSIPEHWQAHIGTPARVRFDPDQAGLQPESDPLAADSESHGYTLVLRSHLSGLLRHETPPEGEFSSQTVTPERDQVERSDPAGASLTAAPAPGAFDTGAAAIGRSAVRQAPSPWPTRSIVESILAVSIFIGLFRLICDVRALQRVLHTRVRIANGSARDLLDALLRDARLSVPVHLASSSRLAVPVALSVPHNQICLPQRVLHTLSRPVRRWLKRHPQYHRYFAPTSAS